MNMNIAPLTHYASIEEVVSALESLSKADNIRIKQIAKLRCLGLSTFNWQDLVNESISRALSGARRWPNHIPFLVFIVQTMRSVASDEWKRLTSEQVITESQMKNSDEQSAVSIADIAVNFVHPEREVIARDSLNKVMALFENDPESIAIIVGLGEGASPLEIQKAEKMTATKYASAQRRIRRALARYGVVEE